jgi:hypothetical protein
MFVFYASADATASTVVVNFGGVVTRLADNNLNPVSLSSITVGSQFSGSVAYSTDSPVIRDITGLRDYGLQGSTLSLNINGLTFESLTTPLLRVLSQESPGGISGVILSSQPVSLPSGWSVSNPSFPFFTVFFQDATAIHRSLALPLTASDFPPVSGILRFDTTPQQSVSVDGQNISGRLFLDGTVTSLSVQNLTAAVPEPASLLAWGLVSAAGFVATRLRRRA